MNCIFINASAASEGGGLTIFNQFCASKERDDSNFYIVASPYRPIIEPKHFKWIEIKTDGISSLFFALIGAWIYAHIYRCDKIISFSNLNTLLPFKKRVTYFQNLLVMKGVGFKFKVLRFVMRFLNQRKVNYIFQTPYVRNAFFESFKYGSDGKVFWPGLSVESERTDNKLLLDFEFNSNLNLVVPITNLSYTHKNFDLIIEYALKLPNVNFLVTSDYLPPELPSNIFLIKSLSKNDFLQLVKLSDGVIITSEYETLCLPIFEALQHNKPAFVLSRDYVEGLYLMFGDIEGVFRFSDVNSLNEQINISKLSVQKFKKAEYSIGQWNF